MRAAVAVLIGATIALLAAVPAGAATRNCRTQFDVPAGAGGEFGYRLLPSSAACFPYASGQGGIRGTWTTRSEERGGETVITGITMDLNGTFESRCSGGRLVGRSFNVIPRYFKQEAPRAFFATFLPDSNVFRGTRTLNGVKRTISGRWEAPGRVRILVYRISITDRNGTCTIVVRNHVIRQDETRVPCLKSKFRIGFRCWNAEISDRDGTVRFFRLPSGTRIGMVAELRGRFPVTCDSPGGTLAPATTIGNAIIDPLPSFYVLLRAEDNIVAPDPQPAIDAEERSPVTGEVVRSLHGFLRPPDQVVISSFSESFQVAGRGLCTATARNVKIGLGVRQVPLS